jgi:hypothetical protein
VIPLLGHLCLYEALRDPVIDHRDPFLGFGDPSVIGASPLISVRVALAAFWLGGASGAYGGARTAALAYLSGRLVGS